MSELQINERAVAFVKDWKNRTDSQQRKYILMSIFAFLLAFALSVIFFFSFQNKNYENIINRNKTYIQDSATQETNQIERELRTGMSFVITLAGRYSTMEEIYADSTVEQKLTILQNQTMFDRIAFVYPDGTDISLEGVADVSDREYFQKALKGKNGYQWLDKSRVTGKSSIVFYAPVEFNGKIIGVMLGFYDRERLDHMFNYQFLNTNPETFLLLGDGSAIASSVSDDISGNLLDELSTKNYLGDVDYEGIKEILSDSSRVQVTFHYIEDGKTYVGSLIQFQNSDWMLLSILPYSIVDQMLSKANGLGKRLLINIVLTFVVVMIVMIIAFKSQRNHSEKDIKAAIDNLEVTLDEERTQLAIIKSLVNVYPSVYLIDLKNYTYQRIKENKEVAANFMSDGDALIVFPEYVKKFVAESYRDEMLEFLDVNTMTQRLEEEYSISHEYKRVNKGWQRANIVIAEVDENNKPVSAVLAVQLIEKEKTAELKTQEALKQAYNAAQLANNAKTTFLSNMSHDIRTPMNAIIGMTAIAGANLENTQKVSDCLKKINSSGKHLLGLINEILDMSKIESGNVDLAEEEFSLPEVIENLIAINQPLIEEKHHTLMVKVIDVKNEDVIGDSTRLQQVFTNLLSNAIKYTPENGKIEITITEKQTNKPKIGWYEVSFKDNGIGMSEEFQRRMFEPFMRANDERINEIQGTGLGMPIARNIIRMMNGDIKVESKLNEGSTFTVSFILKLQTKDEIVNYADFVNLPVLVVDDDETACESTCTILDSLEMNSEYVMSGMEAVRKTVEHHEKNDDYYAVILDWRMPNMNGIETTREIRKKVGNDIPIIVMSAFDWTEIEQEARQAGVNAFLSKPLFKSKVVNLFKDLLGENSVAQENQTLKDEVKNHSFAGKRVLLVEDNPLNREITVELLSMLGVEIECAENGKLGVDAFNQSSEGYYDMIFMDIQMPVMNGYDATMAIRSLAHPDAKKIPIVAMTANAFSSDVRSAFDSGMNGHIAKPVDIKQLIKSLYDNIGETK